MTHRYGTFLVRYRQHGGNRERISIKHIQSGDQRLTLSMSDALDWIADHVGQGSIENRAVEGHGPAFVTVLLDPDDRPEPRTTASGAGDM